MTTVQPISDVRSALRPALLPVTGYLLVSLAALAALPLLRAHHRQVDSAVWTHAAIVAASAVLLTAVTVRAVRGSTRAYLRLRIASALLVVAIAVVVALPGAFPLWMKVEQGCCGLLLVRVVLLVNSARVRSELRSRSAARGPR